MSEHGKDIITGCARPALSGISNCLYDGFSKSARRGSISMFKLVMLGRTFSVKLAEQQEAMQTSSHLLRLIGEVSTRREGYGDLVLQY